MVQFQPGQSGNPNGRPPGISDKRQLFANLVDSQKEALLTKAIQMALDGNEQMLRLLLNRLLPAKPKDNALLIPEIKDGTPLTQASNVLTLVTEGKLTPDEGNSLMPSILSKAKLIELEEMSKRLDRLEKFCNEYQKNN